MNEFALSTLHNAMFRRKSVRKFDPVPISGEKLDAIINRVKTLNRPDPEIQVEFRVLTKTQVRGMIGAKAPHFLAAYTSNTTDAIMNAAFMLQQMDLFFSAENIGVCWLGMARPVPELVLSDSGLPFIIMLAFGVPAEISRRDSISEFKRKPLHEISNVPDMDDLLEPFRLAPSAMNGQPWYVCGDSTQLHLYVKKSGVVKKIMLKNLPYVDIGIALCHLWISLQYNGCFLECLKSGTPPTLQDYDYVRSMRLL